MGGLLIAIILPTSQRTNSCRVCRKRMHSLSERVLLYCRIDTIANLPLVSLLLALTTGPTEKGKMLDITRDKPIKVAVRVVVPVRDHPKVSFVQYHIL